MAAERKRGRGRHARAGLSLNEQPPGCCLRRVEVERGQPGARSGLRRREAAATTARGPAVLRDRRDGRVRSLAGDRAKPAEAGPPGSEAARTNPAASWFADVPGQAARGFRCGSGDGGHRAPRPSAPAAFERVLFEFARPGTVVLTTPNAEYNVKWPTLPAGQFRHSDHRFEWTRAEFQAWANAVARGSATLSGSCRSATEDPSVGAPTQMAVFTADDTSTIPGTVPGRPDRPVRLREVDICAEAFQTDRSAVVGLSAGRWCRTMRTTSRRPRCVRGAAFHRPQATGSAGRLTVVDATNVQPESRKPLVALAREYHVLAGRDRPRHAGKALPGPEPVAPRPGLRAARHPATAQPAAAVDAWAGAGGLPARSRARRPGGSGRGGRSNASRCGTTGGTSTVRSTSSATCTAAVTSSRSCFEQARLRGPRRRARAGHPDGRKVVFLGDLVDRGPKIAEVLRLVMAMVADGSALCVPGNHDMKLMRKLRGKDVQITHGLGRSLAQLEASRRTSSGGRRLHRRPGEPLRFRRGAASSSPTPA